MNHPCISIIVVNYRTFKQTQLCLRSLRLYTSQPYEVIVVDNNSQDESTEYLKKLPWIFLLENPHPQPTHNNALDLAVQNARGEWILILHSDSFVAKHGWLDEFLSYLRPETLLLATQDRMIWPCGNIWQKIHLWWKRKKQNRRWKKAGKTPKLISHCALFHKSLFLEHHQKFDHPNWEGNLFIDCGEPIQRYCEEKGLPIRWIGVEELSPFLWHFEGATLNTVTHRKIPWKRRFRSWRFYRRGEIQSILQREDLDR